MKASKFIIKNRQSACVMRRATFEIDTHPMGKDVRIKRLYKTIDVTWYTKLSL